MKSRETIWDYIFWGSLVFGSPLLMSYGLNYYPPIDVSLFDKFGSAIFIISLIWAFLFRKKLFPWAHKNKDLKFYEYSGMIVIAVVFTMFFLGLILILSGKNNG